ncbi:WD40 repeat-containing protein HOS15-like isoform X2 [Andrographis paniculata]|uniref:WD40 repeat-containing protein HOS15-like isoform X2 n=1 Tax=Andrographis paniculata TaxID=175694 RepID=UPI0021E73142|nr:WD40 repeat-containing protein HOS15-like isoform X2 [Andrographis paniculata]
MFSITSAELNYLIFRYLNESGFTHTAFTLGYEAGLNKSTIDSSDIPPGALVTFVQKGIQYLELEANLSNDGDDTEEDFQFLHPLDLITKDVNELQKIVIEKKEKNLKDKSKGKEKQNVENGQGLDHRDEMEMEMEKDKNKELARVKENEKQHRDKEKERERQRADKEKEKAKGKEKEEPVEGVSDLNHAQNGVNGKIEENKTDGGAEPMDICSSLATLPCEFPSSDVTLLQGHTSEVFSCAWNPVGSLLASGSGDSTARIWRIDGSSSSNLENGSPSIVLRHFRGRPNEKCKDVTTLDWNAEGSLLATGSYDGQARLWSKEGELIGSLNKHKGPIFSLKWNKKGDLLLSGSVDKTAIVWDVKTGDWKQQLECHSAPILDVDWRNNGSFATCSADSMIYVFKAGDDRPIRCFAGHQAEVNAIKWDPTGSMLASCSDDTTAKIWTTKQDNCVLDLRDHTKEIYTVRWSPTGPGTNNPNKQLLLASASFDSTIKLWDVDGGRLVHSLNGHRDPVYSVAFSPNGNYLASGSLDKCLHIWSVKEAKIIKTYTGNGGIFEVCWNREGNKIAACFANNVVCVLDFRM